MGYENNQFCEICLANRKDNPHYGVYVFDFHWMDNHCMDLRRDKIVHEHKNVMPKETVF